MYVLQYFNPTTFGIISKISPCKHFFYSLTLFLRNFKIFSSFVHSQRNTAPFISRLIHSLKIFFKKSSIPVPSYLQIIGQGRFYPPLPHHAAYRSVLRGSIVYTYFQIVGSHGWISESVHYYRLGKCRVQYLCCFPCSSSAVCQLMYFPFRQMECTKHFIPRPHSSIASSTPHGFCGAAIYPCSYWTLVCLAASSTLRSLSGQLLQVSVLPPASFRPHLTTTPLPLAAPFPLPGGFGQGQTMARQFPFPSSATSNRT